MSFLSSISSYFGSSTKHANKASTHLSNAGAAAYEGGKTVLNGVYNFFSPTAALTAGAAWHSYEAIAGKIIGANAAIQLTNSLASVFGGTKITGVAATATKFAALSLVNYPVGCMAGLLAGSIMATHPKETFEAIKGFGKAVYKFVEAGFELIEAVREAAIALGLKGVELLDSTADETVDVLKETFEDFEADTFLNKDVGLSGTDVVEPLADFPVTDCVPAA